MYRLAFNIPKHLCSRPLSRSYTKRNNVVGKRGSILADWITDKDKRKNWHFHIMTNTPKPKSRNVFENVHRPSKRQNVLNTLFIRNITDVLSTGDIAPEIMGYGIEITGVKIAPCLKILNVYWQIPLHFFEYHEDITTMLNVKAPKIRAELISRNVLGRVPNILFIRDITNSRLAAFEEALKKADLGPETESSIVPDDAFLKDMFSFKSSMKTVNVVEKPVEESQRVEESSSSLPQKPADMRSDICGLNHENLMNKVIALKKKPKSPYQDVRVVSTEHFGNDEDLFSKIPGTTVHCNSDREKLLKQFQKERKKLMNKKDELEDQEETFMYNNQITEMDVSEDQDIDEDFIEEETAERF